jgi:hypothetical protein
MAERATQMIDQRVMAEIAESLREEAADKPKAPKAKRPKRPLLAGGSVADEIAKLKALRDDGTLTEEQYALALDKALGGG